MPIISQGLAIPSGLADGGVASASQIIPLYNTMNAFVIPETVGVFQRAFADDVLYSLTVGGVATQDWTLTTAIPQQNFAMFVMPFSWASGTSPAITFRINATAVTTALGFTNTATSSGLLVAFTAGHDTTDAPRSGFVFGVDTGTLGTWRSNALNADLPNAGITSFGVTVSGGSTAFKFKYIRAFGAFTT